MDLGALNMISRVYSPSPMPSPLPSSLSDIPTRVLKLWCSACGWSVRKSRSNMAAQVDPPKKNKTVHTTAKVCRKPTSFMGFCGLGVWWLRRSKQKPLNLAASIGWQQVAGHHAWKMTFFLWRWKLVLPRFSKWGIFNGLFGGIKSTSCLNMTLKQNASESRHQLHQPRDIWPTPPNTS